jgi:hypothetical protein
VAEQGRHDDGARRLEQDAERHEAAARRLDDTAEVWAHRGDERRARTLRREAERERRLAHVKREQGGAADGEPPRG